MAQTVKVILGQRPAGSFANAEEPRGELVFRPIDDAAAARIRALRAADGSELSECSLAYTRHWASEFYHVEFASAAGCGILRFTFNGRVYHSPPFGPGDRAATRAQLPRRGMLGLLTEEEAAAAAARGALVFPSGDGPDYVYRQSDLATLKGSHYQAKRNFCHRFEAAGEWAYGPLVEAEALQVLEVWARNHALDDEARNEIAAIRADLKDPAKIGGVLHQAGRPVAFAMGERLTRDMLLVAYEKADPDVVGAFAMINREFARREGAGFLWLNRASADGHPNLVKAKESYCPARRLEKFLAFEPGLGEGESLGLVRAEDVPGVIALWQKVFGDDEPFIRGILAESTSFAVRTATGLAAMGHILVRDGVRYLYALATDPAFRGRGYATTLLDAMRAYFMAETIALVPGEPALVDWYRRRGFAVASRGDYVTMTDPPRPGFQITDPMM